MAPTAAVYEAEFSKETESVGNVYDPLREEFRLQLRCEGSELAESLFF